MKQEEVMSATGWRHLKTNDDQVIYMVQIDRIKGKRLETNILKEMKEWNVCGDGYNVKTKETMYIFKKSFESEKEWLKWGRQFPYQLIEIGSKSSKKKPYKLGRAYIDRRRKRA
tara:strand:- start:497 stop:838 length:342 start_codon:yes stop_codon:yes gene_type:complete